MSAMKVQNEIVALALCEGRRSRDKVARRRPYIQAAAEAGLWHPKPGFYVNYSL